MKLQSSKLEDGIEDYLKCTILIFIFVVYSGKWQQCLVTTQTPYCDNLLREKK